MIGLTRVPEGAILSAALLCAVAATWLTAGTRAASRRAGVILALGGSAVPTGGRRRFAEASVRESGRRWGDRCRRALGREYLCLPVGVAVSFMGESVLPLMAGAAAVPLLRWWLRRRQEARTAAVFRAAVVDLCGSVAGELRAGRQPEEALRAALDGGLGALEPPLVAAARYGGDIAGALRGAAEQSGAVELAGVAACWQVAADRGAGLAEALDRVSVALRAERDRREEVLAQLAGTRSTSVMLALLPVFGLLMGSALGARPLWVLLHTPAGLGCLTLGAALEAAGLVWTARIVRGAADGVGKGTP